MKRFLLTVALPTCLLVGCSNDQPLHVSGSASVTPPSSEPRVVGSEVNASARTTTQIEEYHARDNVRDNATGSRTEVDVRTRSNADSRSDTDRTTTTTTETDRVRPVDTSNAGTPAI